VDVVSHDRFRYGLLAAAFCVSTLLFFRLPGIGLIRYRFPAGPFPWIFTSFTLPTAALIIVLIFKSLAKRDPLRANYVKFRRTYELFLDLAVLLTIGTHFLLITKLIILQGLVGRWITYVPTSLVGIILVIAGNLLPRLRPNSAMGIRTRWTLRDETVWMKTHRLGGYFLFAFGLTLIAWTFIDFMGIWWVLGPGAVLTGAGLPLLSYVIWKCERKSSSPFLDNHKEN
jgi:uncharacterized membrane protein